MSSGDDRASDHTWQIIHEQSDVESLPILDLGAYRGWVEQNPPPTDRQIADFVEYVSGAKSWYKHLPLLPPGTDFTFYFDPVAGLDRIVGRHGVTLAIYRTVDTPQYHYTWMTTTEYRARFGYLAFACTAGSAFYWPVHMRVEDGRDFRGLMANNPSRATNLWNDTEEYRLPQDVMDAGTIPLTAVIHDLAPRPIIWEKLFDASGHGSAWPEETGGAQVLNQIIARCRSLLDSGDVSSSTSVDGELARLLEPERVRLRNTMADAMRRAVSVVYG